MKTLIWIKRTLMATVVALTIGLALVPRAEASTSANPSVRVEQPCFLGDGQETGGGKGGGKGGG